ncbi:putative eka-like protein [Erysiphe necator]|uniref:Putative eka-like protein n=1 Tax=Uncinula necator TaxID=52586 RepID=A0A0B1P7E1_UNCNE|nr:putative eka-like protein [Erysiphe necator]
MFFHSNLHSSMIFYNTVLVQPVHFSRDSARNICGEGQKSAILKLENHIIAPRQRQERAWHIHLSMCASIFSNIDSTLAIYKEDNEKEEADIIRKYPQRGIAFESKSGKEKASNSPSKVRLNNSSVASSKPPTLPTQISNHNLEQPVLYLKQKENSWTKVARNGHKKSCAPLSPAGFREIITKRLSVSPASIGLIKPVRSGFALSPYSSDSRKNLLSAARGLFISGATLETASNWTPILVPTIPRSIWTVEGHIEITKSILADEIKRVSSKRPAFVKLYGTSKPDAPHRTWMAFFIDTPRVGFRVFDESGVTKVFKNKQPIEFCKRCNGHTGDREYQAVVRAIAAEAKAAIAEDSD